MTMNANTATKAYANVGIETGAFAADPHKLISMLYQGALLAIANAKNGIKSKNVTAKCKAIFKAVAIIDDGLNASLDKKVGGELAQNLSSLYDYMVIRLTQANLNNDMAALDEVAHLLNDLQGAWESMRTVNAMPDAVALKATKAPPVYAAPLAPPQSQAKATPQPRIVAAVPMATPQQRVANKVQMLYGRM